MFPNPVLPRALLIGGLGSVALILLSIYRARGALIRLPCTALLSTLAAPLVRHQAAVFRAHFRAASAYRPFLPREIAGTGSDCYRRQAAPALRRALLRRPSRVALGFLLIGVFAWQVCHAQDAQWIPVGPAPQAAPDGTLVSGRVTSIAISSDYDTLGHPAMFVGTLGGIWRSADFTATTPKWQPLIDHLTLPVASKVGLLSVNSIVVDARNPRRVFAASGDPALGVLRSLDGGNTWTLTGQAVFAGAWPIGKIIVDPTDGSGNTLYLSGGAAGVYKTFDGGDHWFPRVAGFPSSFRV